MTEQPRTAAGRALHDSQHATGRGKFHRKEGESCALLQAILAIETEAAEPSVARLTAGTHDVLCDNRAHAAKRPHFGWECERAARRIFDVYTRQVVDWDAIAARLAGGIR